MKLSYIATAILATIGTSAMAQAPSTLTPSPSSPAMLGAAPLEDTTTTTGSASFAETNNTMAIGQLQQQLTIRGYPVTVDGVMGAQTRAALQSFQASQGLNATGRINVATLNALGIAAQGGASVGGSIGSNPSGVGGTPSSITNPAGVGSNPGTIGNPSGVGSNPSSIGNPAGVGSNPGTIGNPAGVGSGSASGGAGAAAGAGGGR